MIKIFCFSVSKDGDEGYAYAMAEDGTILGMHYCSHEGYVPIDLGVTEGHREALHRTYSKHYPDGYEMEFVEAANIDGHKELQRAISISELKEASND